MGKMFGIDFVSVRDFAEQIDELAGGKAVKEAVENALKATDEYVTAEVDKAVASSRYNFERSGETKKSIDRDTTVEWEGNLASAKAGFNISGGGLPYIFLMYGTPTIAPDTKLKNAARGEGKHRKKIKEIQQEEFSKVLDRVMK